jgi:predicted nucleic acid-binding protein
MDELIVSDTSCLIVLHKTEQLHLLNALFPVVIVTPEIANEFGEELPQWIRIQKPQDIRFQRVLETQIDIGEASAINLALQIPSRQILIDERKGRKIALEMGLKVLGTVGLLILAKQKMLIPSLDHALQKLSQAGFWLSESLVKDILQKYES